MKEYLQYVKHIGPKLFDSMINYNSTYRIEIISAVDSNIYLPHILKCMLKIQSFRINATTIILYRSYTVAFTINLNFVSIITVNSDIN